MKTFLKIIILLPVLIMTSCAGWIKIQVSGEPGTIIKDEYGFIQGTVGSTGTTEIKVRRDDYRFFMLSRAPGSDIDVPFAVDYRDVGSLDGAGLWLGITVGAVIMPLSMTLLWATFQHDLYQGYRYVPLKTNNDLVK